MREKIAQGSVFLKRKKKKYAGENLLRIKWRDSVISLFYFSICDIATT